MFGRKKSMTHEQKVQYAYDTYRNEVVSALFPEGVTEAGNVIEDLARICNIDLNNCSAGQYEDILNMYTETVAGKVVSGAAEDAILRTLRKKYGKLASGHENDIYAYSQKHMDDRNTARDLPEARKEAVTEASATPESGTNAVEAPEQTEEVAMPVIGEAAADTPEEACNDVIPDVEEEVLGVSEEVDHSEPVELPETGENEEIDETGSADSGEDSLPEEPAFQEEETDGFDTVISFEEETEENPISLTEIPEESIDVGMDTDALKAMYRKTLKKFDLKVDKEDPVLLVMLENKKDFVKKVLKDYSESAEKGIGTIYWTAAYAASIYEKGDADPGKMEKGVFNYIRKNMKTDMNHIDRIASESLKDKKGKLRKPIACFLEKLDLGENWNRLDEKTRKQVLKYAFLLGTQAGIKKS